MRDRTEPMLHGVLNHIILTHSNPVLAKNVRTRHKAAGALEAIAVVALFVSKPPSALRIAGDLNRASIRKCREARRRRFVLRRA